MERALVCTATFATTRTRLCTVVGDFVLSRLTRRATWRPETSCGACTPTGRSGTRREGRPGRDGQRRDGAVQSGGNRPELPSAENKAQHKAIHQDYHPRIRSCPPSCVVSEKGTLREHFWYHARSSHRRASFRGKARSSPWLCGVSAHQNAMITPSTDQAPLCLDSMQGKRGGRKGSCQTPSGLPLSFFIASRCDSL